MSLLLRSRLLQQSRRLFSSKPTTTTTANSQIFVDDNFTIEPGEWNPSHTDPLYRPKWNPSHARNKILSEEDFANRPMVGNDEEAYFANYTEAMATPSWMKMETMSNIYDLYMRLMKGQFERCKGERPVTSHEYAIRIVAQTYQITFERAAAVVTLQHFEERKKDAGEPLLTDFANLMEKQIELELKEAYRYETNGGTPPQHFVEDPVGVIGRKPDKSYKNVHDVWNVDQLVKEAKVKEEKDARLYIDDFVYEQDMIFDEVQLPLGPLKRQVQMRKTLEEKMQKMVKPPKVPLNTTPLPAEGKRRDRYVYAAELINTRDQDGKKKVKKYRSLPNKKHKTGIDIHLATPIVLEKNGKLVAPNLREYQQTSWKLPEYKPARPYKFVQQAWIDRTIRGLKETTDSEGFTVKTWGRSDKEEVSLVGGDDFSLFDLEKKNNGEDDDIDDVEDIDEIDVDTDDYDDRDVKQTKKGAKKIIKDEDE